MVTNGEWEVITSLMIGGSADNEDLARDDGRGGGSGEPFPRVLEEDLAVLQRARLVNHLVQCKLTSAKSRRYK